MKLTEIDQTIELLHELDAVAGEITALERIRGAVSSLAITVNDKVSTLRYVFEPETSNMREWELTAPIVTALGPLLLLRRASLITRLASLGVTVDTTVSP